MAHVLDVQPAIPTVAYSFVGMAAISLEAIALASLIYVRRELGVHRVHSSAQLQAHPLSHAMVLGCVTLTVASAYVQRVIAAQPATLAVLKTPPRVYLAATGAPVPMHLRYLMVSYWCAHV